MAYVFSLATCKINKDPVAFQLHKSDIARLVLEAKNCVKDREQSCIVENLCIRRDFICRDEASQVGDDSEILAAVEGLVGAQDVDCVVYFSDLTNFISKNELTKSGILLS